MEKQRTFWEKQRTLLWVFRHVVLGCNVYIYERPSYFGTCVETVLRQNRYCLSQIKVPKIHNRAKAVDFSTFRKRVRRKRALLCRNI